jgi:hypothetical protein
MGTLNRKSELNFGRIVIVAFLLVFGASLPSGAQQVLVSLVELLADPEEALVKFPEGVSTVGYLQFDAGGTPRLFLTRDHAMAEDIGSALFLFDDTESEGIYGMSCDQEYVRVVGMVEYVQGFSLTKIKYVRRTESDDYCFRREAE